MIVTFGSRYKPEISPQQVTLGTMNPEDDAVSEVLTSHGSFVKLVEATKTAVQTKAKKSGDRSRSLSQTSDHIVAERKRHEQLSQRFMALSPTVPGLKKTNETSILGERVMTLEEQSMEPAVLVKKTDLLIS